MHLRWLALGAILVAPMIAVADSDEVAALDPIMGNWEGEWSDSVSGSQGAIFAKIVARGKGNYAILFEVDLGGQMVPFELKVKKDEDGPNEFTGKLQLGEERGGEADFKYEFEDGEMEGTVKNDQVDVSMELERIYKKPKTLGADPPDDAVILLDEDTNNFQSVGGGPCKWKLEDGVLTAGGGNIISKEKFKDHELHVEFRTPFMPLMRGQARGNSGVYVTGNLEVQVLDSFGNPPRDNEAGGIYSVSEPRYNASLPPGEWQTYDITYHSPKTNTAGDVEEPGEITVKYNGTLIHDHVPVKTATKGGVGGNIGEAGGLLLQDHGNPVQFRNIWAVRIPEKGEESESK